MYRRRELASEVDLILLQRSAVCGQLCELRQSIQAYASTVDAATLTPAQASVALVEVGRIKASASALELFAARAAEARTWKEAGYRSAADQLARHMGTTPGVAREVLDTGRRLLSQPDIAQSALQGELSPQQAALVSSGAEADPSRRRELLERARDTSITELQDEVTRLRASSIDAERRRQAIRARRSFRSWTDTEGGWQARILGNPEDGARIRYVLETIRRRLMAKGKDQEEKRESLDALAFDSLLILARVATGAHGELTLGDLRELGLFPDIESLAGPAAEDPATAPQSSDVPPGRHRRGRKRRKVSGIKVEMQVRVDFDTVLRGAPVDGELCEIVGFGPVAVSTIEDLLANDNVFLSAVLTRGHQVVGVKRFGRAPTAEQKSALTFFYPTCAVKGCVAKVGLQSDHREDWSKTHFTVFDLMDRLCVHHHRLKTNDDWALVAGRGKREFVPPSDPRHPRSRSLFGDPAP